MANLTAQPSRLNLDVSPNQQWLVFEWGDNAFGNREEYRLWLIKLRKLND